MVSTTFHCVLIIERWVALIRATRTRRNATPPVAGQDAIDAEIITMTQILASMPQISNGWRFRNEEPG